jgi:hypothetical protein
LQYGEPVLLKKLQRPSLVLGAMASVVLFSSCGGSSIPASVIRSVTAGHEAVYTIPPGSESWLHNSVLLTIYGRGFEVAPILGRLGYDSSFSDLHAQVQPFKVGIKRNDGGRRVIVAVHLIYGLATNPCGAAANCVFTLEASGVNVVKQYIKPALKRHWLVFLDTQLGTSSPVDAVRHMIRKDFLRYDNVEVAIDPEFHLWQPYSPDLVPGLAFGSVSAKEINAAQRLLNAYVYRERLPHKKILLVHQFLTTMVLRRWEVRNSYHNVQVVFNADGLGPPGLKVETYEALVGPQYHYGVKYRGIKLFLANSQVDAQHTDIPSMQWPQVFGRWPVLFEGKKFWMRPKPNVVIIA